MAIKFSTKQFEGFTHRFKVHLDTPNGTDGIDIYSNSDSYQELEQFLQEKKTDKVISFKITHRASKEEDERIAELIDSVLNGL